LTIFYKDYLQYYEKRISGVLKELDIHIACEEKIPVQKLSNLLCITDYEIRNFSNDSEVPAPLALDILKNSSSYLSEMLKREMDTKANGVYTKEHLAYIYGIDTKTLSNIFNELNLSFAKVEDLPNVFEKVKLI